MRTTLAAIALLACAPVAAEDAAPNDFHPVAAGNNWAITESECLINANWDGGATIMVNRHNDHYDLGLYDRGLKGVVDEKIVPVRFGAGGTIVTGRDYIALGHRNPEATAYVSDVDEGLLDRIAQAGTFQWYRGKTLLADLDISGFPEALKAMRACEAARPKPEEEGAAAAAADAAAEATDASPPEQ